MLPFVHNVVARSLEVSLLERFAQRCDSSTRLLTEIALHINSCCLRPNRGAASMSRVPFLDKTKLVMRCFWCHSSVDSACRFRCCRSKLFALRRCKLLLHGAVLQPLRRESIL